MRVLAAMALAVLVPGFLPAGGISESTDGESARGPAAAVRIQAHPEAPTVPGVAGAGSSCSGAGATTCPGPVWTGQEPLSVVAVFDLSSSVSGRAAARRRWRDSDALFGTRRRGSLCTPGVHPLGGTARRLGRNLRRCRGRGRGVTQRRSGSVQQCSHPGIRPSRRQAGTSGPGGLHGWRRRRQLGSRFVAALRRCWSAARPARDYRASEPDPVRPGRWDLREHQRRRSGEPDPFRGPSPAGFRTRPAWSEECGSLLGVDLPGRDQRGQLVRTSGDAAEIEAALAGALDALQPE